MTASNTDLLKKYLSLFSTTLSTGIGTGTGDTITPASVSGLATDTAVTLTIDRVDSGGVATPTKMERIKGVISGGNLTSYVRGVDGTTEQAHSAGAVVEMVWNSDDWNNMVDWGLVSHNQDGSIGASKVVASNISASAVTAGKLAASSVVAGNLAASVMATAAEVATGTDDTKIVTPLAAAPYGYSSMARQAIINGNFDVWQRGTTFATCPGIAYYADRWVAYDGGGTSQTKISRQDGTGVYGSYYCARFGRVASSTDTNGCFLGQPLGSLDSIKFRNKKLTLSFWARKGANFSATSDLLVGKILSGTSTDGAITTVGTDIGSVNCTLTTTWTKFTATTSAVVADTVTQLAVRFSYTGTGTAGAADYFEITQVQLCAGDVALPFQPKSFEEELRACQRYYEKSFDYATAPADSAGVLGSLTVVNAATGNYNPVGQAQYKVSKRITVTPTLYNTGASHADKIRNVSASTNHPATITSAGQSGFFVNVNNSATTAAQILSTHWTAEAEL